MGREEELLRLLSCWDATAARTTVAVVRGEAGIGKSRLVAAAAVEVHRHGGRVVLGACANGPQRPYEPFVAALAADLARLSDDELVRLGTWAVTLARLDADVAARLDVARRDIVDPERERAAVQAALHDYLSWAARSHPLLFVVEDLHWGSVGTRDAVAHIARSGGDAPLMLVVTIRDERPVRDRDVAAFVDQLANQAGVEVIALSGLGVPAAALVIDEMGGVLDPEQGVRETGGNPLFLRELVRAGPGSRSLRQLVADRQTSLSRRDLDVVDVAAICGEQVDVTLVAEALDRSPADVLDSLEKAEASGLIGAGTPPGRFAFTHDIYRSIHDASLTLSRRLRLHAAVAHALSRRAGDRAVI
ncbi:MAG TPA: AAA family ATPase, partial [Ilumatobacteraceae bacterium]|nr:AAA family ATPase [Ilumatobacteraceae bacterium]